MVKVEPFNVEQWMDKYETRARYNIAETCCDSITPEDLYRLSSPTSPTPTFPFPINRRLTYGPIRGNPTLLSHIASLYPALSPSPTPVPIPAISSSNILTTPGAISANFLLFYTLINPGDHVVCMYPAYQALYGVAEALGAKVDFWRINVGEEGETGLPKLEELRELLEKGKRGSGGTKLIVINNPNNPTGLILPTNYLLDAISLASEYGNIPILSDEVYRPIYHSPFTNSGSPPASILQLYPHSIATGSLSKSYSLAGIRVGWLATHRTDILSLCASARDYLTISVSQLDESVATMALCPSTRTPLVSRNTSLAATNLEILDFYITNENGFPKGSARYVKPQGGTTAFVQFLERDGEPVNDVMFCEELIGEKGGRVLVVPGSKCFGEEFKGYVRIGYCGNTQELREGLEKIKEYVRKRWGIVE